MTRTNFTDPNVLARYAAPIRGMVAEWTSDDRAAQVLAAPAGSELAAGQPLIRALRTLAAAPIDFAERTTGEVTEILALGVAGYVLERATTLPGYSRFANELRAHAVAGRFAKFLDALWEAEAAVHFHDGSDELNARFEPSPNPDIWVDVNRGGEVVAYPCECKRIGTADPKQQDLNEFVLAVDAWVEQSQLPPMKVLVHLRTRPDAALLEAVTAALGDFGVRVASGLDAWATTSVAEGTAQVTVQPLGELAEMQRRPVNVEDVAPVGPMVCRAETVYEGETQDPVAILSLIRVRSDVLPDGVGGFERNLKKAIDQLQRSPSQGPVGFVAVRIRPPRGLGDVYEADRIVRRVLKETGATHVGFVMLAWNESEEERQQLDEPGAHRRLLEYHLRAHYVTNPSASSPFTHLDSALARFGAFPERLLRDPGSGQLVPAARDFLEDPALGGDVPEDEDRFTLFLEHDTPYAPERIGPFPSYFRRGEKRLAAFFQPDCQVQFVELTKGEVSAVASIDMRAWLGESKLLFWICWTATGFQVSMPLGDADDPFVARSTKVQGVFVNVDSGPQ